MFVDGGSCNKVLTCVNMLPLLIYCLLDVDLSVGDIAIPIVLGKSFKMNINKSYP